MNKANLNRIIIGTTIIFVALAYILYEAVDSSWAYYFTVDEFVESDIYKTENNKTFIRIAGIVENESIIRKTEKMQLDFILKGNQHSLPVRYVGTIPANFKAGKEIVVEGKLDSNKIFRATKILTRCESKYKAKLQKNDK